MLQATNPNKLQYKDSRWCQCSHHSYFRHVFLHMKWIQVCIYNDTNCTADNWFFVYSSLSLLPLGYNLCEGKLLAILFTTAVNAVVYHLFPLQEFCIHFLAAGCVCCLLRAHSRFLSWALSCYRELLCPRLCPFSVTSRCSMSCRLCCVWGWGGGIYKGLPTLPQSRITLKDLSVLKLPCDLLRSFWNYIMVQILCLI